MNESSVDCCEAGMHGPESGDDSGKYPQGYQKLPWILAIWSRPGPLRRITLGVRIMFAFSILFAIILLSIHTFVVKVRWLVPAAAGAFLLPGIFQIVARVFLKPSVRIRVTSSEVSVVNHEAGCEASPVDIPVSSVRALSRSGERYPPDAFSLVSGETTLAECRIGEIRDPFVYADVWRYFSQDPSLRLPLKEYAGTSGDRSGYPRKTWAIFLAWGLIILFLILWGVYEETMER